MENDWNTDIYINSIVYRLRHSIRLSLSIDLYIVFLVYCIFQNDTFRVSPQNVLLSLSPIPWISPLVWAPMSHLKFDHKLQGAKSTTDGSFLFTHACISIFYKNAFLKIPHPLVFFVCFYAQWHPMKKCY